MAQRNWPSYAEWPVDRSVDTPYSVDCTVPAFYFLSLIILSPALADMNATFDGLSSRAAVYCYCFPVCWIDVAWLHVAFYNIYEQSTGLPAGLEPVASTPYSRSFGMWPSSILTWPSHLSCIWINKANMLGMLAGVIKTFLGDTVLPADVQDRFETAHVERVELTVLTGVLSPGFASAQECTEYASLVNRHLGVCCQHWVVPNTLSTKIYQSAFLRIPDKPIQTNVPCSTPRGALQGGGHYKWRITLAYWQEPAPIK